MDGMLIRALGLEQARLVSLCGAGGKTTLMFALAREFAAAGERVLVTTTTKIAKAEADGPWPVVTFDGTLVVPPAAALVAIAVSDVIDDGNKLAGIAPDAIDRLKEEAGFDRILVEADGAAQRPLKAPADHEPVIPPATDRLIIVAGLNGLGQPLNEENLFRSDLWAMRTGLVPGAPVSAESLGHMIVHDDGLARGCPDRADRTLFLNRADDPWRLAGAKRVTKTLAAATGRVPDRVVTGTLLPSPVVVDDVVFF
ncbi:MAG: putative selenium-dependent hydroxylase accessory protein YqeC [Alphaproteobacteria bacterium]|nr:putative selenium-dependent hydroxylase accessory protein YqeC [Alphaproteobacteria bacterium]